MVSIIVLVYNRPRLTRQTLDSLWQSLRHTKIEYELIVVDNGSDKVTKDMLKRYYDGFHCINLNQNIGIGAGKNLGVNEALYDNLYISDNDMYFDPGWLETITQTATAFPQAKIIGAFRHPYHGVITTHEAKGATFEQSDQQVGSSWFFTKKTWSQYGPLLENVAYGVDDVAMCNKVTASGFWVGSMLPYKVHHCGVTNSDGEKSPGSHLLLAKPNNQKRYLE
jgi:glycosyltransferase involved in cell wall biosynthesis